MDSERDVTDLVRSWLRTDEHESADRVLDDVLAMLETNTQRPARWPIRGISGLRSAAWLAIAAAAVVVVAVAGSIMLPTGSGTGGASSALPTPATSPERTPITRPAIGPGAEVAIEPGSFVISTSQARVHLTVPAGWLSSDPLSRDPTEVYVFPGLWTGMLSLAVTPFDISYVVRDVCAGEAAIDLDKVGPTVEDLTLALSEQAGVQRAGPTDVMLGGYPAKKFVLKVPPDCPSFGHGLWADASRTYGVSLRHGATDTVYVVNVNGERLVITSEYMNQATAEHIAELEAITASIDIEPVPGAAPLPALAGGGSLAIGRHSLTVDGVPLSFGVPAFEWDKPYGWARYGSLYISKDTAGSQGAEAAIYWTAFPDGADTDPCTNLLGLPADVSAADLAAAVASAPGTELVSGPSEVTVGGRVAGYVAVSVRDPGCDPGFFFTWPGGQGGPFWSTTNPGDTIRAWVVDVDERLLFIAGATHDDAGAKVEQEIRDIVDSIQFE